MTLFQSLATAAGYDPIAGPGSSCNASNSSGRCVLPWAGGTKAVASVVLVANGIGYTVMALIFTTLASGADYGMFGRWLFLVITIICWGAQYSSIVLTSKSPDFSLIFNSDDLHHAQLQTVGVLRWSSTSLASSVTLQHLYFMPHCFRALLAIHHIQNS